MANRMNDQRSFFTKFITSTPVTDHPVLIIGNSFGKMLLTSLKSKHGFRNIHFAEVKDSSLSLESLQTLAETLKEDCQVLKDDPIVIFLGLSNSTLKPRDGRLLKVIPGTPNHIEGQVFQISDKEFFDRLENTAKFLSHLGKKSILIPPFPRHFTRCCHHFNHFDRDYDGIESIQNIRDWGIFMAQFSPLNDEDCFVPFLPSIFGTEMFKSGFNGNDGVHLVAKHSQAFHQAMADVLCSVLLKTTAPHALTPILGPSVHLAKWKEEFRIKFKNDLPEPTLAPPKPKPSQGHRPGGHYQRGRRDLRGGRGRYNPMW